MKRIHHFRYLALAVGIPILVAIAIVPLASAAGPAPTPEQAVQRAWQRAHEAGVYHFASEIVQTTYPAPAIANFGRTSRQDALYLEGDVDLPAHTIGMSLWKNGNVLNSRDGLEVRIEGDRAWGRQIGGTWQEMDDFSDAFAPSGDLMAFLAGAKNVKREEAESRITHHVSRFTFDLDGPAFASHLRDQLEAYLRERGELPIGLTLDSSRVYQEMTGQGEIWLDEDGLPLRLSVHLAYPQEKNGERVKVDIRTDFRFSILDFRLASAQSPTSNIQSPIRNTQYAIRLAALLGVLGLVLLVLIRRRSKPVYSAIVLIVIFSLVVMPLMQSQQAAAFFDRQAARQARYEQEQQAAETSQAIAAELSGANWNPHADPLLGGTHGNSEELIGTQGNLGVSSILPSSPEFPRVPPSSSELAAAASASVDTDNDGLSDDVETAIGTNPTAADSDGDGLSDGIEVLRLGTDPLLADSDNDGIRDNVEVAGFTYRGQKWYFNPNNPDTNGDGLPDGTECPALVGVTSVPTTTVSCDTDNDGVPDGFDLDNDGDGVNDRTDLSALAVLDAAGRRSNLGTVTPFDDDHPLMLNLPGLRPGKPVMLDVQLRPTLSNHLGYALNVFDWPSGDQAGQIQRVKETTFKTTDSAAQNTDDPRSDYGDMRLIPMLEIEMPAAVGGTQPFSLTLPSVTVEVRGAVSATLTLARPAGDTASTSVTPDLETTTAQMKIWDGPCSASGTGTGNRLVYKELTDGVKAYFYRKLTDLADGQHALELTAGGATACANIPNIINGPYRDWMIDQAPLAPYGISVQEKDTAGTLLAYVPLNAEADETGGGLAAFSARMLYWPNGNPSAPAATWTRAQSFRVVWLVQVLTDYCDRHGFSPTVTREEDADQYAKELEAHCLTHRSQDIPKIAHTYTDEQWYVTGISVREDSTLDVAVLWEDPDADDNLQVDNRLWQAARGLASAFSTGRDCDNDVADGTDYDPATHTCHADGKRDVVVAARNNGNTTIFNRLDAAGNVPDGDVRRWGIPKDALRTATYSYPHSDYTAEMATTKTRELLHQAFGAYETANSAVRPTLLYAREETFRGATLNELGSVSDDVLTMDMSGIESTTLSTLSWAPFRYNADAGPDGETIGWEPYPMADYWRALRADLEVGLAALSRNQNLGHSDDYIVGQSVAAADIYLAFYRGLPAVVAQGGQSLWRSPWEDGSQATVGDAGSDSGIADAIGLAGGAYGLFSDLADDFAEALAPAASGVTNAAAVQGATQAASGATAAAGGAKKVTLEKMGKGFKGILGAWKEAFDPSNTFKVMSKFGKVGLGLCYAAAGAAVIFTIAAMAQGGDAFAQVGNALTIIGLVFQMKGLLSALQEVIKATTTVAGKFATITQGITSTVGKLAKCFKESLSKSAVIGFGVGVVATWAAMGLTVGLSNLSHVQTGYAVAQAVADTIVQVLMIAINAIPLIGPLISAVISLIDSLIGAICNAIPHEEDDDPYNDAADWLCGGIEGLVSHLLAFIFYSGTVMVDVNADGRFRIAAFDEGDLVYPERGMAVGNFLRPTITVSNTIEMVPLPHNLGGAYPYQYSDRRLRGSTFKYQFGAGEVDLHEGLERYTMSDEWQYVDGDGPRWGDAGHTWHKAEPVYIKPTVTSATAIELSEAGINRTLAMMLSEGYAIPAQECILGVCGVRTERDTIHYPISDMIIVDAFPATQDGFREFVTLPNGQKALAWSQTGDSFAALNDADNDRLPFTVDPDDSRWDSDYDGLGDYFELQIGTDPTKRDTDGDGLSDWEEVFRRTEPLVPDTDGDGLLDGEEVFHQDVFDTDNDGNRTEWLGGWEFVYSMNADGTANQTWTWPPPDERDVDADNLSDSMEKVYGFNPRVPSDGRVLTLQSIATEPDGSGEYAPSDGYVKPGDPLRYEATVKNELFNRYAQGLLSAAFPTGLHGSAAPQTFVLQPQQARTLTGDVTVASTAASGVYSMTQTAGALIVDWAELAKQSTLWLPFEDPITADRSGSIPEHQQTCTGTCASVLGRFGNGLSLNGSSFMRSDKVLPQAEASISLWFKTTAAVGTLAAEDTATGRRVYLKDGKVCGKAWFSASNAEEICTGVAYHDGAWHHVVYTIGGTGGVQRLYVDSVLRAAGTATSRNVGTVGALYVGYGSVYFSGQLDELRTYDRALSQSEVSALFNQPVLYWEMDTATTFSGGGYTGQRWPDSSPLGITGYCTTINCPALWQGVSGNAAGFVGWQYLGNGDPALNLQAGQVTLAAWIWPSSSAPETCIAAEHGACTLYQPRGIIGYQSGTSNAYPTLQQTGRRLRFGFGIGSTPMPYVTTGEVLTRDAWNHVAATYVNGVVRIYVNGLLVKEDSGTFVDDSTGIPYQPPATTSVWVGRSSAVGTLRLKHTAVTDERDPGATAGLCMAFSSGGITQGIFDQDVRKDNSYDIGKNQTVSESGTLHLWEDDGGVRCGTTNDGSGTRKDDDIGTFSWDTNTASSPHTPGYMRLNESKAYSGEVTGSVYYIWDNDSIPFYGSIDEVMIYNRALDGDTIAEMYRNTSVLLHLRLDEPPGETAFKDAASDRRASCSGSACPTSGLPGRVGQAAGFDGNDVLTLPNSAANRLTHGFTVAAWVKPDAVSSVQRVVSSSRQKSVNGWTFGLDGDGLRFTTYEVKDYGLTGLGLPAGRWMHIAAVLDENDDVTFYLNGVNRGKVEHNAPANADTDDVLLIGASTIRGTSTLTETFTGQLDDVRVIGRSLSAADILDLYRSAPVLQLSLDDARGATQFADSSPNGLTASCSGGCPAVGEGVVGRLRGAAEFDGYDDRLTVANNAALQFDTWTVGAWVYPTQDSGGQGQELAAKCERDMAHLGGVKNCNYRLFLPANSLRPAACFTKGASYYGVTSAVSLVKNQWGHVMATFDGLRLRIYVNGTLQGESTLPSTMTPDKAANSFYLARYWPVEYHDGFRGRLDEVTVYARPLTGIEIYNTYLYQRGWVEERFSHDITVDADTPTSTLATPASFLAQASTVLLATASDATSGIGGVELGSCRAAGGCAPTTWEAADQCTDATEDGAWCPTFNPTVEGRYTLKARATDVAGNRAESADSITVYVDNQAPSVGLDQAAGALLNATPHPTQANAWVVHLSGTVSDPPLSDGNAGSGIPADGVHVTLLGAKGAAAGWGRQMATVSGSTWSLDYVMREANPSGSYTVRVEAQDVVARLTGLPPDQVSRHTAVLERGIVVDGAAPSVGFDATSVPAGFITGGTTLGGDATERAVDLALDWVAPAGTGDQVGVTITCNDVQLYDIPPGTYPAPGGAYGWQGTTHQGAACQVAVQGGAGGTVKVCGEQIATWPAGSGGTSFTANSVTCSRGGVTAAEASAAAADSSVSGIAGVEVGFTSAMPGSPFYQDPIAASELLHLTFADAPAANGSITYRDVTGHGHDGTCSGPATCPGTTQSPETGQAALFDGVDDTVSLKTAAGLNPQAGLLTLALWLRVDGGSGLLMKVFNWGAYPQYIVLYVNSTGQIRVDAHDNHGWNFTLYGFGKALQTWYHVALTRDAAGVWSLYVDGVLQDSKTASFDMSSLPQAFTLAPRSTSSPAFCGGMDDLRLFDRTLTAAEIKDLASNTFDGKITLALPFDQAMMVDGSTLADSSGAGRDATLVTGAGDTANKAVTSKVGSNALQLDGIDDYAAVADSSGLNLSAGSFTQAAWVYPQPTDNAAYPVIGAGALVAPSLAYPFIEVVNRKQVSAGFGDGTALQRITTGDLLTENAWNHIATTFDGTTYTVYINGTARYETNALSGKLPAATSRLDVGRGSLATSSGCARITFKTLTPHADANYYDLYFGDRVYKGPLHATVNRALAVDQYRDFCGSGTVQVRAHWSGAWRSLGTMAVGTTPGAGQFRASAGGKSATVTWEVTASMADQRFFRGRLDDLKIWNRVLSPLEIQELAAQGWRPATLAQSGAGVGVTNWQLVPPAGLEGYYTVETRGRDVAGHDRASGLAWQGNVDTVAPRVAISRTAIATGYHYATVAEDFNLTEDGFRTPCGAGIIDTRSYFAAPWYFTIDPTGQRLFRVTAECDVGPLGLAEVGWKAISGYARGIAYSAGKAYLAADVVGLQIVDVTNPAAPAALGQLAWKYMDGRGVALDTNLAYLANGRWGLDVIDITQASYPAWLGRYDSPGTASGVALAGSYAYLADGAAGLRIVDVSNPAAPSEAAAYDTAGTAYGVVVSEPRVATVARATPPGKPASAALTNDLPDLIVEIFAEPDTIAPGQSTTLTIEVQNQGNEAFDLDGIAYLHVYEDHEPTPCDGDSGSARAWELWRMEPGESRTFTTTFSYGSAGTHFYYAQADSECAVLESDDDNNIAGPAEVEVVTPSGRYAFVADGSAGVQIIDVTNPTAPALASSYNTAGTAYDVALGNDYILYVADGVAGLVVLDVTYPYAPALVARYDTPGDARGLAFADGRVYLADGGDGLLVFDVSDPAAPALAASFDTPGFASDVAVSGRYAYVADYSGDLRVIDLEAPLSATACDAAGNCTTVTANALAEGLSTSRAARNTQYVTCNPTCPSPSRVSRRPWPAPIPSASPVRRRAACRRCGH